MGFKVNVEQLIQHPDVEYADETTIRLKGDFLIEIFQAWKLSRRCQKIEEVLSSHGLGKDTTGPDYAAYLDKDFQEHGYPVLTSFGMKQESHPLVQSGKFYYRNGKIQATPELIEKISGLYPGMRMWDAMVHLGINPVDVGRYGLRRIKYELRGREKAVPEPVKADKDYISESTLKVDEKTIPESEPSGDISKVDEEPGPETGPSENTSKADEEPVPESGLSEDTSEVDEESVPESGPFEEKPCNSKKNPYIKVKRYRRLVPTECFYNDAYPLGPLGIDRIFQIFELDSENIYESTLVRIYTRLSKWEYQADLEPDLSDPVVLRIWQARIKAMDQLAEDQFRGIGKAMKQADIRTRKKLCRQIGELPYDESRVYTVTRILGLLDLPKSTYYALLNDDSYGISEGRRHDEDEQDIAVIRKVLDYRGFAKGARQVYMLMPRVAGRKMGLHRIRRLMKKYGITTQIRRMSRNRRAMRELVDRNRKSNLLLRRFRLHRPNEVRLTDVTYLDYGNGERAYGSASIDPATGRLICFVISEKNDLQLALDTLKAMDDHPAKQGAILHSDQGILYLTDAFQAAVVEKELEQSMSRRGNCWDNAPQEAFFGHFKDESGYEKCQTIEELRDKVKEYAVYYNEERGIWERGKMTPVEYEAWLDAMTEEEFSAYIAEEEEKYRKTREESAEKAIIRAREYQENRLAKVKENKNEAGQ